MSGLMPSGVSSLAMSNHSGLNSIRGCVAGLFRATLLTSAITASAIATSGLQRGWFSGDGLRMHQAQCSISSV